jgi:hypothetical protein
LINEIEKRFDLILDTAVDGIKKHPDVDVLSGFVNEWNSVLQNMNDSIGDVHELSLKNFIKNSDALKKMINTGNKPWKDFMLETSIVDRIVMDTMKFFSSFSNSVTSSKGISHTSRLLSLIERSEQFIIDSVERIKPVVTQYKENIIGCFESEFEEISKIINEKKALMETLKAVAAKKREKEHTRLEAKIECLDMLSKKIAESTE